MAPSREPPIANVIAKDFHVTGPDFFGFPPDEGGGGIEENAREQR